MEISVVIPARNEEETIVGVLGKIKSVMAKSRKSFEIIVVDDGSDDKTEQLVKKVRGVKMIRHPYNRGYGAALKTGIRHASGKWVLITDADGTYPAEDIPRLLEHTGDYDMVVGSRTGKDVNIPLHRRPGKWFLSKLANYLSGTKIPDLNSGLRIFRKEDAARFFNILPHGFSFTTTITLAYISNDYSVKYVPIDYHERGGKSKIRPVRDGVGFALLIIKTITYFNPLKTFLPTSLALLVAAALVFFYSFFVIGKIMDVTITVLIITSIQIGFLGLVADSIAKR